MCGIFTYFWVVLGVNVGKYTIHWASIYTSKYIYIYICTFSQFPSCSPTQL